MNPSDYSGNSLNSAALETEQIRYRLLCNEERLKQHTKGLREDFGYFVRQVFKTVSPADEYQHNWHIDAMCEALEACRRGEIRRLIINVPPRSMKSITCTVAWPAWLLGHSPATQIMCASYAKSLSLKHSSDTRLVMESEWYQMAFPRVRMAADQNAKEKFVTTARGQRLAVSVGAAATGEGGHYLIMDDPVNPQQAASDTERETANEWFGQTFMNRLNDKKTGVVVVVMQRLHEEDVSGSRLAKGGWTHLKLPARFEMNGVVEIGRFRRAVKKGEFLDRHRLDREVLTEQKKEMGEYAYSGQYQQNPSPSEGGILKKRWWKKWPKDGPPDCLFIVLSLDTGYEAKETNDPTAMTAWGIFPTRDKDGEESYGCILLDMFNERLEYPELKKRIIELNRFHLPDRILIEKKASGISLLQDLRRAGLPVKGIKVTKNNDKVARAHAASIVLERGCVWYMDRDWAKEVIDQCGKFPNDVHDDLVDTCTQIWLWLRMKFWLGLPEDEDMEPIEEIRAAQPKRRFYGAGQPTAR